MSRAYFIVSRRRPFRRSFERAFGERSWTTVAAVRNLLAAVERTARPLGDTSGPLYVTKEPGEWEGRARRGRDKGQARS